MRPRTICLTVSVLSIASFPLEVRGQRSSRQDKQAVKRAVEELGRAAEDVNVRRFLRNSAVVLESGKRRAVSTVLDAYSGLAQELAEQDSGARLYYLHRKTAASLARVSGDVALGEWKRLRGRADDWRNRVLLLDAAALNDDLDVEPLCLEALNDRGPAVTRRALKYLARDKKVSVVEAIVARYVELEGKYSEDGADGSRTLLAFRAALQEMFQVDLPAAADWKNYVASHKNSSDFFEPPARRASGKTDVTLFGAAVTGRHIVFVLDVSGSMMSTDPLPPEEARKSKGKTVVRKRQQREVPENRRRINRAKRELGRVIKSLPESVKFNFVSYSTSVTPWKGSMVRATSKNKKAASKFVDRLDAEGITVTDRALEEAFADLEVDTIYLITDGAPTHIGSTGPGLPDDAAALIDQIHKSVRELNFLRDVRIFCLGFTGAKEEFLIKLAKDNRGTYVPIR